MLVLSRKRSERILIGDEISITVVSIDRNQVRIGIEAPPHIGVLRSELRSRDEAQAVATGAAPVARALSRVKG